jgi:single-stranded-DNA-specific exonuclease
MSWAHRIKPLKWVLAQEPDSDLVSSLQQATDLPLNIVKILINRHLDTPDGIKQFLNPALTDLKDPFEMEGMEAGIERVTQALMNNEKIMIYGIG